jgi:hypothetical protein
MKKLIKITLLIVVLMVSPFEKTISQTSALQSNNTNFIAEYDRLLDYYTHNINVGRTAFSGDGKVIFFSGKNADSDLVLRKINSDGTNLSSISIPSGVTGVDDVAINQDGSTAFFLDSGNDYIYKVEGTTVTEILHRTDFSGINDIERIETTAGGSYVYFSDGGEIRRISHNGGTPELIIDDETVQRNEGTGKGIGKFAISANGSFIGFVLERYLDSENHTHTKYELFVYNEGNIKQLTNDTENVYKEYLDLSGDGSTIVFSASSSVDSWYSIKTDGTDKVTLEDLNSNRHTVSLKYDGSKLLLGSALGSRLVNTDGSGGINIFPSTGKIGIHDNGYISSDGSVISFRYQIRTFPSRYALYVGYLYELGVVPEAPVIESITFDPVAMPTENPNAKLKVFSKISDPNGLDDIDAIIIDGLLDGTILPNIQSEAPVYFYTDPNDNGGGYDETANDGIFTIAGDAGGKINEVNQMTVRISALDKSSSVVVKDVTLNIGGSTAIEKKENSISNFTLFQNYPNPFNPTTTIGYSFPTNSFVKLKIYDIVGSEIKTLVNEEKQAGNYEVIFDGSELVSGVYFYNIQVFEPSGRGIMSFSNTKKLLLIK